jgi:hypothetical protein
MLSSIFVPPSLQSVLREHEAVLKVVMPIYRAADGEAAGTDVDESVSADPKCASTIPAPLVD